MYSVVQLLNNIHTCEEDDCRSLVEFGLRRGNLKNLICPLQCSHNYLHRLS